MTKRIFLTLALLSLQLFGNACGQAKNRATTPDELLLSWKDGSSKSAIISFVNMVCDPQSASYVPPEDRKALVDMDGTLLCEKPRYIEVIVVEHRLREKAIADPELVKKPLYRAALSYDTEYIHENVKEAILEAFVGEDIGWLASYWRDFLSHTKHPTLGLEYVDLIYTPMIELVHYLQAMDFSVFIVSTSQQEFIRSFLPYHLPVSEKNVIGTVVGFELQNLADESPHSFVRIRKYFDPYNADQGKTVRLRERGVESAILAVGNSMGDYAMLDGVSDSELPNLILVVDHDDQKREFEYRKPDLLAEAKRRDWTIISMKDDFLTVFPDK